MGKEIFQMSLKKFFERFLTAMLSFGICALSACGSGLSSEQASSVTSDTGFANSATPDTSEVSSASTVSRLNDQQIKMTAYLGNWSKKIDTVKERADGRFTFCIQTDTHYSDLNNKNIANNVAALSNFVDFKFIANLGDLVRGYSVEDVDSPENTRACMDELVKRYTENSACPVFMTVGNHDTNKMWCEKHGDHTYQITPDEQLGRVFIPLQDYNGDLIVSGGNGSYYYADFPSDNIRIVVLNTADGAYDGSGYSRTIYITDTQVDWFKSEALNTDKSVIVMTHVPLVADFPEAGNTVPNGNLILEAIEEFSENGGDFLAYFYGHTHGQYDYRDQNGRLHVSFKNGGDIAEAVIIDSEKRMVETVGFGVGDRNFSF